MISFADAPFVVTLKNGTTAVDDGDILLLGVSPAAGGLLLAAGGLSWEPLENIEVLTIEKLYESPKDE